MYHVHRVAHNTIRRPYLVCVSGASLNAGAVVSVAEREVAADVAVGAVGPVAAARARPVAAAAIVHASAVAACRRTHCRQIVTL